jgi:hypothetical protein
MHARTLRLAAVGAALALIAAACSSSAKSSNASSTTMMEGGSSMPGGTSGAAMMLPPYAKTMKTNFSSPADNTTVTGNTLSVTVDTAGYQDSCDWAGRAPKQGSGHYHLLLDKSLINMYCTPNASVSMQNVKPGKHTLEVVPALNDHAEVSENGQSLGFDYQPTAPLAAITDASPSGTPSIKIVSPQPGATIAGPFDVVVNIKNFRPDCDLFGKPDVTGYGHWHLNFDSSTGGMGGMATMAGMSCQTVLHTTTTGLSTGTHKLIAILVGNSHAPLNPMISDTVSVTVG